MRRAKVRIPLAIADRPARTCDCARRPMRRRRSAAVEPAHCAVHSAIASCMTSPLRAHAHESHAVPHPFRVTNSASTCVLTARPVSVMRSLCCRLNSSSPATTAGLSLVARRLMMLALCVCTCVCSVRAAACVGVPNRHVCVTLSPNATRACTPPDSTVNGLDYGFWYILDDGQGANTIGRNRTFVVNQPGATITFQLVTSTGEADDDFFCHPFAIVPSKIRGGCRRIPCALGPQSGVSGPIPAYGNGALITLTARVNNTYGFQSTYDTDMGGFIVVSNQSPPPPAPDTPDPADPDGGDGEGGSGLRSTPVGGIVVGVLVGAIMVAALVYTAVVARRRRYWTGYCVCNSNPNLAATDAIAAGSAGSSSSSVVPLPAIVVPIHSGDGGGGGGSGGGTTTIDTSHVQLKEEPISQPQATPSHR